MKKSGFYAQHQEDEILRTFLGEKDPVFYIDVGAWEPTIDSVTKHFYDRGGRGVNIEPVPFYYDRLVHERSRDTNLLCALGATPEMREFFYVESSGLSTFEHEYAATAHASQGRQVLPIPTPVRTLKWVCENHVPADTPIDFLKIDVEGWEKEVILGGDWKRFRPRLLCIEATVPMTDTPAWDAWEPIVLGHSYLFLAYDGLNRYYQASEAILTPP